MKTLLIGYKGNMGRRYAACLDYLGEEWIGVDIDSSDVFEASKECNKAIIATPTDSHLGELHGLYPLGWIGRILCEKPIARTSSKRELYWEGHDLRMVCNWQFAINLVLTRHRDIMVKGETKIEYDCYNTGNDGLAWDCIQLIHLAGPKNITLKNKSPVMECLVRTERNPTGYQITTREIEESYVVMLSNWINDPKSLWGREEIIKAHEEVIEYMEVEK